MISVVIPTYNEEHYLPQLLKKLNEGDTPDHEIIVVDGHSRDKTREIAEFHNCRVLLRQRKGISDARNFGANQAKGKVVAFLDADSLPCDDWLMRVEDNFKDVSINAIGGPTEYKNILYDSFTGLIFRTNPITRHLGFWYFSANNSAYRKIFFDNYCGFRDVICEDIELSLRLKKFYSTFRFIDNMTVQLSTRRFEKAGFFRTLTQWCISDVLIFLGKGVSSKGYSDILR